MKKAFFPSNQQSESGVEGKISMSTLLRKATASVLIVSALGLLVLAFRATHGLHSEKRTLLPNPLGLPLASDQVILRYNGGQIRVRDLDGDITKQVVDAAEDMYKESAQKLLLERLLIAEAKKQSKPSVEALLEAIGTTMPVTEDDIA